jgi:hypothetical protein
MAVIPMVLVRYFSLKIVHPAVTGGVIKIIIVLMKTMHKSEITVASYFPHVMAKPYTNAEMIIHLTR